MLSHRRLLTTLVMLALLLLCGASAPALAEIASDYDINTPQNLREDQLFCESALLVDEASGETLFTKNSRIRMYPASTTKIMTLLLALESGIPLDSQVTIPAEAGDVPQGSSVIPVYPGDVMSFSDLLYGFMLSSGNDGANAIAVLVDGGIEPFVERMNRRAEALGCQGTHYVNAHGYHDPMHYTTAADLAVIAMAAMKDGRFRDIVAAPKWTMRIQRGGEAVETEIVSRNTLLIEGEKYYYPDCTGIKTGHHNKAGWCFVGSAERDGMRVICVVLNCAEEMSKWYDAARLFEYGFTRYRPVPLSELVARCGEEYDEIQVENADPEDPQAGSLSLELGPLENGDQTLQVVDGSEAALDAAVDRVAAALEVTWARPVQAPVAAGERLGTLTVELEGMARAAGALRASRAVAEPPARRAPDPTRLPEAQADEAPPAPRRGSGAARVALLALFLLALLACVAGLLAVRRARRRRARRRRARRGRGYPPRR